MSSPQGEDPVGPLWSQFQPCPQLPGASPFRATYSNFSQCCWRFLACVSPRFGLACWLVRFP
eukprot:575467-Prorocentrum_lima.AAC.1